MAVLSLHVKPGSTVVDVGANMGFVTTMLASLVGPSGTVVSFEPSQRTFGKLLKTISANDLKQVIPHNSGIGSQREMLELVAVSKSSGNNTLVPAGGASGVSRETVELVTLDEVELLQERRVSLLKIDTEGFEFEVLQGSRSVIERDAPVIHTELGGGGGYADTTLQAIEVLQKLGYDTSMVEEVDWESVGNGVDFTFVPKDAA